ncbi:MAG: tetratricopeptide repeat protein, partial [Chloroflexaceae bacterium]|nr:tetratricopeptide repeat protein [Chloroflexaceae bacterium]
MRSTPTIGRDAELHELLAAVYALFERGEAWTLVVVGEAGVGKTRLVQEARKRLDDITEPFEYWLAEATPATSGRPFALVGTLIASACGVRPGDERATLRPRLAQRLQTLLPGNSDDAAAFISYLLGYSPADHPDVLASLAEPQQFYSRAMHYCSRFIGALAATMPLVLLLENLHWADRSSLELLHQVLKENQHLPLLLIGTSRQQLPVLLPTGIQKQPTPQELVLNPLCAADCSRLFDGLLTPAAALPDSLRRFVLERAAGNPFYMEELIKQLIADRVLVAGANGWQVHMNRLESQHVPQSLDDLLRLRLATLTIVERRLLEQAAVIGSHFWDTLLASLEPDPTASIPRMLKQLVQRGLIEVEPCSSPGATQGYRFSNVLLHEVVYANISPALRQGYHGQVARWWQSYDSSATVVIATHLERAGERVAAAEWFRRAAASAHETSVLDVSQHYYQHALALYNGDPGTIASQMSCYRALGRIALMRSETDKAAQAFSRMRVLAEQQRDEMVQAQAWIGICRSHMQRAQYADGLESAVRAEMHARGSGDLQVQIETMLLKAHLHYHLGKPDVVLTIGQQALALSSMLNDVANTARCYNLLGIGYGMSSHYTEAITCFEQALAHFRALDNRGGVSMTLNNMGVRARRWGDFQAALGYFSEALALQQQSGMRDGMLLSYRNLGRAKADVGNYSGAETDALTALRMAEVS